MQRLCPKLSLTAAFKSAEEGKEWRQRLCSSTGAFYFGCPKRGQLGSGSFSKAFLLATYSRADPGKPLEKFVLKVTSLADYHQKQFLETEDSVLTAVDHPNVVKLYAHGSDQWSFFQVLQFGDLGEMGKYMQKQYGIGKPLSLAQQFEWLLVFEKIALGLHEIHGKGFLHRDMKNSNVVLAQADDGAIEPIIIDFGFAIKLNIDKTVYGKPTFLSEKYDSQALGTPLFMAPEIINGSGWIGYSTKGEVFALGVTLFGMMQGRDNPFGLQRPSFSAPKPYKLFGPIIKEIALIIEGSLLFEKGKRFDIPQILKLISDCKAKKDAHSIEVLEKTYALTNSKLELGQHSSQTYYSLTQKEAPKEAIYYSPKKQPTVEPLKKVQAQPTGPKVETGLTLAT